MLNTEICKNVGNMQIGCRGSLNLLVCVIVLQINPVTQWDVCASLPMWPGGLRSPPRQGQRRGKCSGSLLNHLRGFFLFYLLLRWSLRTLKWRSVCLILCLKKANWFLCCFYLFCNLIWNRQTKTTPTGRAFMFISHMVYFVMRQSPALTSYL